MNRSRIVLLLALALALAAPAPSWARAGGGGGGGGFGGGGFGGPSSSASRPYGSSGQPSGGGLWILIPIFAVGALVVFGPDVVTRYARRRARLLEAATMQEMRTGQPAGQREFVALTDRVRLCFFKVQDAWSSRDVSLSRPFVSDALYERHRAQLAKMERRHLKNRIKDLVLRDVRVVRLERGPDGKAARCAARIEASARDWVADLGRGVVVDGDPDAHRRFVEYWSFSRHPVSGWVLDEIRRRDRGLWAVKDSNLQP
jgi:Tim44-like domain